MNEVVIYCSQMSGSESGGLVKFSVESCNEYKDILTKEEWELKKDAWILEVKPNKSVGFISPLERKARKKEEDWE
jgi:hypothetical protein